MAGLAVGQPLSTKEQAKRNKKKKAKQAKQNMPGLIQAVKDAANANAKIAALLAVVEAQDDQIKYLMNGGV